MQHQVHHSLSCVVVSLVVTKTTDLFSSAFHSQNANINYLSSISAVCCHLVENPSSLVQENQKPTVVESDSV